MKAQAKGAGDHVSAAGDWHKANQRYLLEAIGEVRRALERHLERAGRQTAAATDPAAAMNPAGATEPARVPLADLAAAMPAPPALETLGGTFGLSTFERDVLLLCAGIELEASFAALCAAAQGDARRPYPSFGLALAALPGAHWSALSPSGPLRRWRLVDVGAGDGLTMSPVRIDERVLHYLVGVQHPDDRLRGLVEPVEAAGDLVPSHQALAAQIAALWSKAVGTGLLPIIQICGRDPAVQRAVASAACARLGLELCAVPAFALPVDSREAEALARLWEREAALSGSALLLDAGEDTHDAMRDAALARFVESLRSPVILASPFRRALPHRPVVTIEVRPLAADEQRALWRLVLGDGAAPLDGHVDHLASQFQLDPSGVRGACAEALAPATQGEASHALASRLWDACRRQASPRLDDLTHRIEPTASWDDLVLPGPQRTILREIAVHVRHRGTVCETWGFADKSSRGLGISALFAGPSGTGKTMAAEVLANELRLDLYRIDLSQVVSKYIGETEKNLRRVFDTAEGSGAILLFDEADALFGRRSEVRDSHDRYANVEISYLLQRMEAYRGLAILTTNMKEALDPAFLRRIRFIVPFPFPDAAQRAEIWRRIFPLQTPTEGLDSTRLARLNVTGGTIWNIALAAAFRAADTGAPVRMAHLLEAARAECAKLERPLTEAEIGGWV